MQQGQRFSTKQHQHTRGANKKNDGDEETHDTNIGMNSKRSRVMDSATNTSNTVGGAGAGNSTGDGPTVQLDAAAETNAGLEPSSSASEAPRLRTLSATGMILMEFVANRAARRGERRRLMARASEGTVEE